MTSTISTITFDAASPSRLQDFWAAALGYMKDECVDDWALIKPPGESAGVALFFQKVPEGKAVKNRVHIDLEHEDPKAEAERLIELGATIHTPHDTWFVMQDPEGNEFCVTRRA